MPPLVWETFAHRLEYRPPPNDSIRKAFDAPPSYGFKDATINWNGIDPSEHFVFLDEDSEVKTCYVFGQPNIEKITTKDNLIMYMAKLNRVEYEFRKKHFNSHNRLRNATMKNQFRKRN